MKTLPAETTSCDRTLAGSPVSLVSIIQRIEDAIERETRRSARMPNFDIKESNTRKSRYLYELTQGDEGAGQRDLRPEHRAGMQRLRASSNENEQVILAHLNAVSEVAAMIQSAIQTSEDDGTYSAGAFGRETVG
jgi:chloramphenicol 3-O-phosphotransferase